jgi:hypothetical protein
MKRHGNLWPQILEFANHQSCVIQKATGASAMFRDVGVKYGNDNGV